MLIPAAEAFVGYGQSPIQARPQAFESSRKTRPGSETPYCNGITAGTLPWRAAGQLDAVG